MKMNPLAARGLSEEEWLHYLYLVTIESSTRNSLHSDEVTVTGVRAFIAHNGVSMCPMCKRWFLDDVGYCPYHHMALQQKTTAELMDMIYQWEEFRIAYCGHVHVHMLLRSSVLKLYRMFREDRVG